VAVTELFELCEPDLGPTRRFEICIPAPAIAEVLLAVRRERREAVTRALAAHTILTCDFEVGIIAAELADSSPKTGRGSVTHQAAKMDHLIAACALRWGAHGICVYDGDHGRALMNGGHTIVYGEPSVFLTNTTANMFPGRGAPRDP
jgi:hypothetical protein